MICKFFIVNNGIITEYFIRCKRCKCKKKFYTNDNFKLFFESVDKKYIALSIFFVLFSFQCLKLFQIKHSENFLSTMCRKKSMNKIN